MKVEAADGNTCAGERPVEIHRGKGFQPVNIFAMSRQAGSLSHVFQWAARDRGY
jgi:hypothetical protein